MRHVFRWAAELMFPRVLPASLVTNVLEGYPLFGGALILDLRCAWEPAESTASAR